jgi:transposase-like protein
MERPLGELRLCALIVDGTPFKGRQMMAAMGVGNDGKKTVLGLREGATENATVVRELWEDLARSGLDFSTPRLYVLDGAKALSSAVKRHAGQAAVIQRCQVHIAGRDPRFPEGWDVPSRASPYEPGSLGSDMVG